MSEEMIDEPYLPCHECGKPTAHGCYECDIPVCDNCMMADGYCVPCNDDMIDDYREEEE